MVEVESVGHPDTLHKKVKDLKYPQLCVLYISYACTYGIYKLYKKVKDI